MTSRVKSALARMQAQPFPDGPPADAELATFPQGFRGNSVPAAAPVHGRRRAVSRRAVLVGGLATAVAATSIAVPPLLGGTAAYAVTPEMLTYTPVAQSARDLLGTLAARAREQPAAQANGHYHYMHQRGWYLGVAGDTEGRILSSGINEIIREQWIAPDGSGRLRRDDGRSAVSDEHFGPGGLLAGFVREGGMPEVIRSSGSGGKDAVGVLRAVADLWGRQVLSPRQQADLLLILADQAGLSVLGETTDRAGRVGVAIGAEHREGAGERLVLVFAPSTGALLDVESIVLKDSDLPVKAPATIEYTVWLATGHTSSLQSRP
jgi:hypothetical protein